MTINNQPVQFLEGATILEIATAAGIHIPTLCYQQGLHPTGGCGVCVVEDLDTGKIMPSCATLAIESLNLSSNSQRVTEVRNSALELLLSDHPADCEAPCRMACPSGLPVQQMLQLVAARRWDEARAIARRYPFVCGDKYCDTACERACRRSKLGGAVAICAIHRKLCDDVSLEPTRKARSAHAFRSRMTGLDDEVLLRMAAEQGVRIYSGQGPIDNELAVYEAKRCLNCGCGRPDTCELRDLCGTLGVRQGGATGSTRAVAREQGARGFRFDSTRCILCGRCVRATQLLGSGKIAPGFHGRGFDARIAPPLGRTWDDMEEQTLAACVAACPTGAMWME
ncbi:MAG: 2Fe-2S iron-sulfur cluster-binding protein [Kiritimatiellae bacterium]|nr:2Fe-2S iron-sulfur cluster-binding protein [Kiritimatiellia bacterium]